MKSVLISALSAVALLAVAPAANAGSGYVGAAYTRAEVDTGFGDDDADGYGIEGAYAFQATPSLGVQIDGAFNDTDDDEAYGVTGHVHARNDSYLFGGFVGLADVADETVWSVGLEGEKYYNNVTVAAAAGYASADDSDADIYGVDGQVRYFLSDNFRIQGALGYAKVEAGPADDNVWSAGVGGEYQFAALPVSVFGGYSHSEFDDADISSDAFTIGVRYNFGGSLKDRDRKGASLAGLSSLTSRAGL